MPCQLSIYLIKSKIQSCPIILINNDLHLSSILLNKLFIIAF
ncbi:hypothetical protein A1OE_653 [Candidatus Endolissoclinum faulkneri L2]|uniref:Uncharacterized protein n=1 Tax=Candidatus Endolissoclinum faulkneri L2 TaxID=1193729 RepID=K7ZCR6_9PROT|nr:hypothetical protein A1OE_653 [Candidatus Endolissoclinum faulkneri L2]